MTCGSMQTPLLSLATNAIMDEHTFIKCKSDLQMNLWLLVRRSIHLRVYQLVFYLTYTVYRYVVNMGSPSTSCWLMHRCASCAYNWRADWRDVKDIYPICLFVQIFLIRLWKKCLRNQDVRLLCVDIAQYYIVDEKIFTFKLCTLVSGEPCQICCRFKRQCVYNIWPGYKSKLNHRCPCHPIKLFGQ